MTINTSACATVIQGNDATTVFTYDFLIPNTDDLIVTYTDADAVETPLGPSEFSVIGIGNPLGGSVTYPLSGSPIATGTSLTIQRLLPLTQEVEIANQGNFYPQAVEQGLDALEMQIQQVHTELVDLEIALSTFPPIAILPVPSGGTGTGSFTENSVIIGNGTAPLKFTGPGTAGYVLTSNGASLIPTFQPATSSYDLPVFLEGKPTNGEVFPIYNMVRNLRLPADMAGSGCTIAINPAADLEVSVQQNGIEVGTITFNTAGIATIDVGEVDFFIGDQLSCVYPNPADTTGEGISITFLFQVI